MTTDQLINELVWMPGRRSITIRWFDGGSESHVLNTDPGSMLNEGYGHIRRLADVLNGLLEGKPVPLTILHDAYPDGKNVADGVVEHPPTVAYQVEARKGRWRTVSPTRVKKRFQLASVPGAFEFGRWKK